MSPLRYLINAIAPAALISLREHKRDDLSALKNGPARDVLRLWLECRTAEHLLSLLLLILTIAQLVAELSCWYGKGSCAEAYQCL